MFVCIHRKSPLGAANIQHLAFANLSARSQIQFRASLVMRRGEGRGKRCLPVFAHSLCIYLDGRRSFLALFLQFLLFLSLSTLILNMHSESWREKSEPPGVSLHPSFPGFQALGSLSRQIHLRVKPLRFVSWDCSHPFLQCGPPAAITWSAWPAQLKLSGVIAVWWAGTVLSTFFHYSRWKEVKATGLNCSPLIDRITYC